MGQLRNPIKLNKNNEKNKTKFFILKKKNKYIRYKNEVGPFRCRGRNAVKPEKKIKGKNEKEKTKKRNRKNGEQKMSQQVSTELSDARPSVTPPPSRRWLVAAITSIISIGRVDAAGASGRASFFLFHPIFFFFFFFLFFFFWVKSKWPQPLPFHWTQRSARNEERTQQINQRQRGGGRHAQEISVKTEKICVGKNAVWQEMLSKT